MSELFSLTELTAELEGATSSTVGVDCLRRSVRAAIKLELATIPPYLTAEWSIVDPTRTDPVATAINEIVREEMSHMGLACNMLTALGESPNLATTDFVPSYPGTLPGDVHPGFVIGLRRLTPSQLKAFIDIEYPEGGPISALSARSFATIGAFYEALCRAFARVNPRIDTTRQRTVAASHIDVHIMKNVDQVIDAINVIRHQGEGSRKSPDADTPHSELAHYYRFREVYIGAKYIFDAATKTWGHTGDPILMPPVVPMADIPAGGYKQADVSPEVWTLVATFDQTYTRMLKQLTLAWTDPSSPLCDYSSDDPIATMLLLRDPAQQLMAKRRPDGTSTYGPCFRLA